MRRTDPRRTTDTADTDHRSDPRRTTDTPLTASDDKTSPQPPGPKTKPRRRGRPPGRANHDRPPTRASLPHCPRCQSTQLRSQGLARVRPLSGIHAGKPFNSIHWQRAICQQCGQHSMVISHHYAPNGTP